MTKYLEISKKQKDEADIQANGCLLTSNLL